MDFQSEVVDLVARIKGSAKVEIAVYDETATGVMAASTAATDAVSWQSVGSIEGLNCKEELTETELMGDNADEGGYVSGQFETISFNQREASLLDVRTITRGTFDTSGTPVAAALVAGAEQTLVSGDWAYLDNIKIEHQNGAGTAITVNSVTGGTDGLLVVDVDYWLTVDEDGEYCVMIDNSNALTNLTTVTQNIVIDYDYTPYASQTIYRGGLTALPYFSLRLTNTDENGLLIRIWYWKCKMTAGSDFQFKKDKDADPVLSNPMQIKAVLDTSLTAGYQLGKTYYERGL